MSKQNYVMWSHHYLMSEHYYVMLCGFIIIYKANFFPRKRWLRPNMTEKLFTRTLSIKQTNQTNFDASEFCFNCIIHVRQSYKVRLCMLSLRNGKHWITSREYLSSGFKTWSDTKRAVQP